jgi:type II secretory pathway pseudopilin PulG
MTLIELLVSLPVATVVATAAVTLLLVTQRHARRLDEAMTGYQQLEAARRVLSADLRRVRSSDLVQLSDSLLSWTVPRWIGVLCAVDSTAVTERTLVVASLEEEKPEAPPLGTGWELEVWGHHTSDLTASPIAMRRVIRDPVKPHAPDRCTPSGSTPVPLWRIPWGGGSDGTATPEVGFPVVVLEPVRYHHYRSGTRWWLGRTRRTASGWDILQPVAGPLAAPVEGGMQVTVLTAGGRITPSLRDASAVAIRFRGRSSSGSVGRPLGLVTSLASVTSPRD